VGENIRGRGEMDWDFGSVLVLLYCICAERERGREIAAFLVVMQGKREKESVCINVERGGEKKEKGWVGLIL
jgi:hypothetical protein